VRTEARSEDSAGAPAVSLSQTAELRLRQATTGTGLTEAEIRAAAGSLADAISLLSAASPEDCRRVYEAAQPEALYDHENQRAQFSVAPSGKWCRRGDLNSPPPSGNERQQAAGSGKQRQQATGRNATCRSLPLLAAGCH
jgi:hypothetical protein